MNLFEIKQEISNVYDNLIDVETGEINEEAVKQLENLTVQREEKIENTGLYLKDLKYKIEALKEEKRNIDKRLKTIENTETYLKNMLSAELKGQKFETPKTRISFRKSESVNVDDGFIKYAKENGFDNLIRTKVTETADKTALKKLLEAGENIQFCSLEEKQNIQIK